MKKKKKEETKKQPILMKGLGVSAGIAIGRAYLIDRGRLETREFCHIDSRGAEQEVARFNKALAESKSQLLNIREKLKKDGIAKEHISIIDANMMIFEDQMLIDDTVKVIREEKINAEWALKKVLKGIIEIFDKMDDEYLKQRSSDIEHSINRILVNLMGTKHESISEIARPSIVVSHDLSPSDTAQMKKGRVLGFLTNIGGRTSHTAIMARSLEIPAIVGLEHVTHQISTGDTVIIDGTTGTVIANPSKSVIESYKKRKQRFENYEKTLLSYHGLPSVTTDGKNIGLMGNMELVEEVGSLLDHGAEGIGLYRSEFLYINRKDLPNETEHFNAYKKVAKKMGDKPVTIRTLDIGGDKPLPHMGMPEESNPALGLRAIRFCLQRADIFKIQLRGILRASACGNVKIMFPMISCVDELREAKEILETAKEELRSEGKKFDEAIKVGVMIEIPSAALIADKLAKEADFFSIGTNDLIQYSLAIDRVNEHVAYLYEPTHPGVLRIIKQVVDAARKEGVSVGVCGEMAGEPLYALVFLGLGIEHLSMSSSSLLRVKRFIRSASFEEAKKITKAAFKFSTAKEIEHYLSKKVTDICRDEF